MTAIVKWNTIDDIWSDIEVASKGSYLLQKGELIYNLDEDGLISETEYSLPLLTKAIFEDDGFSDLSVLVDESIFDMKLLAISETIPSISAGAIPHPQLVLSNKDILLKMANKIINFQVSANYTVEGDLKIVFSTNSGETWMTYDGVLMQLEEIVNIEDLDEVALKGMTISTFNSIGLKWNDVIKDGRIKFGYYLEMEDENDVAEVDKLEVTIETTGRWRKSKKVKDFDYEYGNETLSVSLYNDGSYKINYMV